MQGALARRYRVVPRTLVFVRRRDRVLLIRKRLGSAVWPGRFNGLGGHVEAGENIVGAARREVFEEAGLRLQALRLAGVIDVTDPGAEVGVAVYVFTARAEEEAVVPSDEGTLHWVPLEQATELDLVPDLRQILPRLWPETPARPFVAVASLSGGSGMRFADMG